jgi:hypothetical protein
MELKAICLRTNSYVVPAGHENVIKFSTFTEILI